MLDSLEILKRLAIIEDNGPLYNEFVHNSTVHEPWNAYSSLFFFIPIIFWLWKLKGQYKQHLIIVAILPLLFLNGLGSTLFHAFRNSTALHLLDWLPASLMSLTLATYFWTKLVKKWYFSLLIVFGFFGLGRLAILLLSTNDNLKDYAPNVSYIFVGLALFLPIIILLYRIKFRFYKSILLTLLFLVLALFSRALDYPSENVFANSLPQGTHFLWHIFSSFAVFSLGFFLYNLTNWEKNQADK